MTAKGKPAKQCCDGFSFSYCRHALPVLVEPPGSCVLTGALIRRESTLSRPGFQEGMRGLLGGLASFLSVGSPGASSTFVILLEKGYPESLQTRTEKITKFIIFVEAAFTHHLLRLRKILPH